MEKTTVYLTSRQKEALARAAAAEGRSEALLIRAGIDVVTAGHRSAETMGVLAPSVPLPSGEPQSEHPGRPRWMAKAVFARAIIGRQADPGLRADLSELAPGSTDDEPLP